MLSARTRLAYGVGMAAEGVKNNGFSVHLLFFYQQVLGVDAALVGLALFVALVVDAVSDPLVGAWSDETRSRLGRRHPWMFAAVLPFTVCFLAVFLPPPALGPRARVAWLLAFAVGTRLAMTLFAVPHAALGAELSPDPTERARLMAWRAGFGWAFGLANAWLAYTVFLSGPRGLHDPAGYAALGVFGAGVILTSTAASALGTLPAAPARRPEHAPRPPWGTLLREAWSVRPYRRVVFAGLAFALAFGISENLVNYLNTFFWGLEPAELGLFVLGILGSTLAATALAAPLARHLGAPRAAALGVVVSIGGLQGAIAARLLGLLPANDDPALLPVLLAIVTVAYTGFVLVFAMIPTMIAACTDLHAAATGARREGLLFAAHTFLGKATTGLGVLAAGGVVALAGLAPDSVPGEVAPDVLTRLGALSIAVGVTCGLLALAALRGVARDLAPAGGPGSRA